MRTQIRSAQEVIDDALTFSEGKTFTNCGELEKAATDKYDVKIACLSIFSPTSVSYLVDESVPSYEIGYYSRHLPFRLFQLGHEVCHVVLGHLHPDKGYDPAIGEDITKEIRNREANLFAWTILGWTEKDEKHARRIAKLKDYFPYLIVSSFPNIKHRELKYLKENGFKELPGWLYNYYFPLLSNSKITKPSTLDQSKITKPSILDHILVYTPIPVLAEIKTEKVLAHDEEVMKGKYSKSMRAIFHFGYGMIRYACVPASLYIIVSNL